VARGWFRAALAAMLRAEDKVTVPSTPVQALSLARSTQEISQIDMHEA